MDRKNPIIIVGGGLGGLTAALALARRNWPVRVLEGAPEFGAIGYGIQFGPNVFHVFDRIGVSAAVLEKANSPPAVLMFDALTGKEVTRVPTGRPSFRDRFNYPYIIIHRIDVHNVLLDACRRNPLVALEPNAMVTQLEDRGDEVTARTADGRSFEGSALIGADGIRSRTRAQLFDDGDPLPNGFMGFRTIVPMANVTCRRPARHRRAVGRSRLPHGALSAPPRHAVQYRGGVPPVGSFGARRCGGLPGRT